MMSLKNLLFFIFMVTHAVNALFPKELFELSEKLSKLDLEAQKKLLTDSIADELKSDNLSIESNGEDEKEENDEKNTPNFEKKSSESRLEGSWLDMDSEPTSLIDDDPDDNDALYSRESTNPSKRDDYFESLEKKSLRSTYVPLPRKNYYTVPENIDSSSSEEHEEKPDYRRAPRMADHEDHYPEKDSLTDVIHAESNPFMDSLHLIPMPNMYPPRTMQVPPWRFLEGKADPRKHIPPPVPSPAIEEKPKSPKPSPDPLVTKAAVHRPRGTFKQSSTIPRRPMQGHMKKTYHHDAPKVKSLPRSKPWATEYKKESISRKFMGSDTFVVPPGFSKPIRQQFHEQGTHGPHSYKFGYSTGDKENPMARYEERGADGIVRGSYSYVDPRGQKQIVNYESHPKFGFKTRTSSNY